MFLSYDSIVMNIFYEDQKQRGHIKELLAHSNGA